MFKPGETVIATPKDTYKLGIGLYKTLDELNFIVPQIWYQNLIHCEYGPMIVLESEAISNKWCFKVLGINKAVGWTVTRNPNFGSNSPYYLERFVP